MKWINSYVGRLAAGVALLLLPQGAVRAAGTAKNVIICISDGCGYNSFYAASYYQYGRLGCQPYEQPGWTRLSSRTISLNQLRSSYASRSKNTGTDPGSVWDPTFDAAAAMSISAGIPFKGYNILKKDPTDSAAAATAMAMGTRVLNGHLNYTGSRAGSEKRAAKGKTIAEIAKALGKSTGVITTVQWNDATPAAFGGAHAISRTSRHDLANEMLTNGTLDVIMGAGHPEYDANGAPRQPTKEADYDIMGGSFTWDLLKSGTHSCGWKLIETKADFEALMSGPTPARVIGIPHVPGTVQQERRTQDWNGDGRIDSADIKVAPPFKDPFIPTVPTLVTMTKGALNILGKNPNGFYIMIEGGAVDHAAHSNQPGRLIEEQVDFNNSVQAVVDWVNKYSNWDETLVLVSADHETGLIWGTNSDTVAFQRLANHGPGWMPGLYFNHGNHTVSLVPLYARGPGASLFAKKLGGTDSVYGDYVENTTIFDVMSAAIKGRSLDRGPHSTEVEDTSAYGTTSDEESAAEESSEMPGSQYSPMDNSFRGDDTANSNKSNGDTSSKKSTSNSRGTRNTRASKTSAKTTTDTNTDKSTDTSKSNGNNGD